MKPLDRNEWQTPIRLFDWLHHGRQFNFTHDAAATDKNACCSEYNTKERSLFDELPAPNSRIFCNPPYDQARKFAEYIYEFCRNGDHQALLLLPVRSDRVWWNELKNAPGVRHEFYTGRIHFSGAGTGAFMYNVNFIFGFDEIESRPYIDAGQFNEGGKGGART